MAQDRLIWFGGELVPAGAARVPVLSPTAQFGLNVFEGIRAYWHDGHAALSLFRLPEHLARLEASCKLMGLQSPYGAEDIAVAINAVIHANGYREDIALRVTLFVGGEGSWAADGPVEMFVAPIARARRDVDAPGGVRAKISTWERIDDRAMPPRVKAGANYINGRYAHQEARAAGYDLPILLDRQGRVSEGAGACVMMVRDGVLITPPTTGSILESITRDTLLRLAAAEGINTRVRVIDRTELYLAEEVFMCGTAAEVTPVVAIDRHQIGAGSAGPVTRTLLRAYLEVADGTDTAHPEWRMAVGEAPFA